MSRWIPEEGPGVFWTGELQHNATYVNTCMMEGNNQNIINPRTRKSEASNKMDRAGFKTTNAKSKATKMKSKAMEHVSMKAMNAKTKRIDSVRFETNNVTPKAMDYVIPDTSLIRNRRTEALQSEPLWMVKPARANKLKQ